MDRRSFLTLSGAVLVAGCSGSDGGSTPASTAAPTPSPEPTPSPTPEPKAPSVEAVSLVSRWDEYGDAISEQVNAVGQGAPALIAYRHSSEVHDGTLDVTEQVRVFDDGGTRVGIQDTTDEQLVDASGYQSWEHGVSFETDRWDLGGYEAELLVRDNITGKTSETATASFLVNDPLVGSAARLVGVDAPNSVRIGERYEYDATVENTSTRDGSVVSTLSARFLPNGDWYTYPDFQLATTMATGETNTYEGFIGEFSSEGTVQFRIDDIDGTWRVDVTE